MAHFAFRDGERVRIAGLQTPTGQRLNGRQAFVCGSSPNEVTGKWEIRLAGGSDTRTRKLKAENLTRLDLEHVLVVHQPAQTRTTPNAKVTVEADINRQDAGRRGVVAHMQSQKSQALGMAAAAQWEREQKHQIHMRRPKLAEFISGTDGDTGHSPVHSTAASAQTIQVRESNARADVAAVTARTRRVQGGGSSSATTREAAAQAAESRMREARLCAGVRVELAGLAVKDRNGLVGVVQGSLHDGRWRVVFDTGQRSPSPKPAKIRPCNLVPL